MLHVYSANGSRRVNKMSSRKKYRFDKIVSNVFKVATREHTFSKVRLDKNEVPNYHSQPNTNIPWGEEPVRLLPPGDKGNFIIETNYGRQPVRVVQENRPFVIELNRQISEPLVCIRIKGKDHTMLVDSGSMVSALSTDIVSMHGLQDYVQPSTIECVGPAGEKLTCVGSVELDFILGGCKFNEKFMILNLNNMVGILGYNFGKRINLKLVYGEYITNDPSYLKEESDIEICNPKSFKPIKVKPVSDVEMPAREYQTVELKLFDTPRKGYDRFVFTPWLLSLKDHEPMIAFLNQNGTFNVSLPNPLSFQYVLESSNLSLGTAIPLQVLNQEDRINRISSTEVVNPIDWGGAEFQWEPESFGIDGIHSPNFTQTEEKFVPLERVGPGFKWNTIPSAPCEKCLEKGHKFYCSFQADCQKASDPCQTVHTGHSKQCFYEFLMKKERGLLVECSEHLSVFSKSFVKEDISLNENDFFIRLLPQANVLIIIKTCSTTARSDAFYTNLKAIIEKNRITKIFLNCSIKNLENLQKKENTQLEIFVSTEVCAYSVCTLCQGKTKVRNVQEKYAACDKTIDQADILTKDPHLIRRYLNIISDNENLFSKHGFDIGQYKDKEGRIVTFHYHLLPGVTPYVSRFIPISELKRKAAGTIIEKLLEHQIIARMCSEWAANAVWVKKAQAAITQKEAAERNIEYKPMQTDKEAQASLRLTVNFRMLNAALVYPCAPLPNIRKCFGQMRHSDVISIIDLTQAFYSLTLSKESSRLTCFWSGIASDFTLGFLRAAMGIKSSPSMLAAAVTSCLQPIRNHLIAYSDNIILHSKLEDHPDLVRQCFELLNLHGFKVKKNKVLIHCTTPVRLLGTVYDVKENRIFPDFEKVRALQDLPVPTTLKQLKSFLGSVQFMASMIIDSGPPLAILYNATRNSSDDNTLTFGGKERQAYQTLINLMTKETNMAYFINYELPIYLIVDSSTQCVGYCLLQYEPTQNRFISCGYFSKVFSQTQSRYGPSERELVGTIIALKSLEDQIWNASVTVVVDCKALLCLIKHSGTSSKIQRFETYLDSFNPPIKFQWQPGTSPAFKIADFLSRPPVACKEVTNRKITVENEHEIARRARVLKETPEPTSHYKLLMDFILKQDIDDLDRLPDTCIYINEMGQVCQDNGNEQVILANNCQRKEQINTFETELAKLGSHPDRGILEPGDPNNGTKSDEVVIESRSDTGQSIADNNPNSHNMMDKVHPKFTGDSVFKVHVIKLDMPMSEVEGLNLNTDLQERLDLKNKKDLFLNFIVLKYPYLDAKKLKDLQANDPAYENIIKECQSSRSQKVVKKHATFTLRHNLLIRICQDYAGSQIYQLCLPKVCVIDTMSAIHRSRTYCHPGAKKLNDKFNQNFYCPDSKAYATLVTQNCFICAVNLPRVRLNRADYPNKIKVRVSKPGVFFFCDSIQISNSTRDEFDCVLCFVDAVTNFIIAIHYKKPLTNKFFMDTFQTRVLTTFPGVRYVQTDNDHGLSSHVTKQAFRLLNIIQLNIRPFNHKANLSEILQRFLLRSIKLSVQSQGVPAEKWHLLLPMAVISLNNTSYYNLSYSLCPQQLQTGIQWDKNSLLAVADTETLEESGYASLACELNNTMLANNLVITELHRKKLENNLKTQKSKAKDDILPGDLVCKINSRLNLQNYNKKLRPRYQEVFLCLARTETKAFLRPYRKNKAKRDELTFKEFLNSPRSQQNKILPSFEVLQVDLVDLRKVKTLITVNDDISELSDSLTLEFPGTIDFMVEMEETTPFVHNTFFSQDIVDELETINLRSDHNENKTSELEEFIAKPALRNIRQKTVRFDNKVTVVENTFPVTNTYETNLTEKYTLAKPIFGSVCTIRSEALF